MTKDEAIKLMESSKSVTDWNANADEVKTANNGNYPNWWYREIIMSGLAGKVTAHFGASAEIAIETVKL
jgi:hypothetical protein